MAAAVDTEVIMGCDTAADHGGTVMFLEGGKIGQFTTSDDWSYPVLIGAAGNGAILAVLRRGLTLPAFHRKDPDSWASEVARRITELLATASPPLTIEEQDGVTAIDGNLLLACDRGLWLIQTHAAMRVRPGIAAVGSGRDLALGSVHADLRHGVTAKAAVESAVRLASTYDSGCGVDDRGPMVYSTRRDG
ncbi:hypothetical protein [Nocardia sp. NPDC058480]|uniref:hypothetical protein n=1 Tax=Nocardia sp. NPDC058480 TaxID=3346522 RepID=UPI003662808D